jgi:hypothetical protein
MFTAFFDIANLIGPKYACECAGNPASISPPAYDVAQ